MKRYNKGPFDSKWSKGGYGRDEKKKRIIRLQLLSALLVMLIMGGSYFLFFRDSTSSLKDRLEKESLKVNDDLPPAVQQNKEEIRRRNIYDRNLNELAISFKVDSIYVKPLEFDNIEKTVAVLANVLNLDEKYVLDELKTQRSYKWVVKNISPEKAAAVAALQLPGVYFYEQEQRYNPSRANMGQIIGEVKEGHGLSGLELFYDSLLLGGQEGPGKSLVLTLDAKMQYLLEQEMTALLNEMRQVDGMAESMTAVSALVMDVNQGEILAYVKLPFFAATKLGMANSFEGVDRMMAGHVDPGALSLIFKAAANFERAQQALAEKQSEEEEGEEQIPVIKMLTPRIMKKLREGPKKSPWVQLEDGTYASEWLASALEDEKAASEEGQLDFSDFGKILDRVGPCKLDLPGDNGGKETGLGMLCGYAALLNGGRPVTPHLLQATIAGTGKPVESPWPSLENMVIGPEASQNLVLFLREKSHPMKDVLLAEVLRPMGEMAAAEEMMEPPVESKTAPAAENAEQVAEQDKKVVKHCNGLALASISIDKPELVMLLVIDDARIDLMQQSPIRLHVDAFLQEAIKLHHQKRLAAVSAQVSREEMFQRWMLRNKQLGIDIVGGKKSDAETMIDVRGMSIRKALQELDPLNVKVVIEGSGKVKRQHPEPGSRLKEGTLVILKAETKS